jgi:phosphotransferase system IIB component
MSLATVGAATNIMSTAATAARLRHELRITRIVLSFRLETAEV